MTQPAQFNKFGKQIALAMHPTTILGLQAVLATGLAIVAQYA
jgi:hypothetical protein